MTSNANDVSRLQCFNADRPVVAVRLMCQSVTPVLVCRSTENIVVTIVLYVHCKHCAAWTTFDESSWYV